MLRKARKYDLKQIKKLIDYSSQLGDILPRPEKNILDNLPSFYVYEENNQIVGCCSLDVYNWKLAEIRSLVVLPGYQRRGIGTKLVKQCVLKAKKLKIYKVLSVTKMDKFFNSLGFKKCLNGQWPMFLKPQG